MSTGELINEFRGTYNIQFALERFQFSPNKRFRRRLDCCALSDLGSDCQAGACESRHMLTLITFVLILSLASDAACEPAELRELFEVPSEAKRTELYQRKEAPPNTFPFYVSLRRTNDDQHFCAGTLISPSYILTSGSCVDRGTAEPTAEGIIADIGIGSRERRENADTIKTALVRSRYIPEYDMRVEAVILHAKYSNGTEGRPPYDARYDIAILKLEQRSRLNWALLPLENLDCCSGEDLLNVGLGRFESEGGDYAESLEMAVFPHLPYEKCRSYFRKRPQDEFFGLGKKGNLTASASLCVSGAGEYCQLDKGSSLVRYRGLEGDFVVVGFANDATRECSYGAPYVFSSISFHIKWIIRLEGVLRDIASSTPIKYVPDGAGVDSEARADLPPLPQPLSAPVSAPVFEPDSAPVFEPDSAPVFEPDSAPTLPLPLPESIDASAGRFPYAASLRHTQFQDHHTCDGVLISPRHILTSASCIRNEGYLVPNEIIVYIGGTHAIPKLDDDGELINATKIIAHPKHREKRNTVDLALVVLRKKSRKTPVRLPVNSRGCCESGTRMRFFAWPRTSMRSEFSHFLQTGQTDYISRKQCVSVHGIQNLNPKAICAGHRFSGIVFCGGDYGMPLLLTGGAEDVLIGIGFANVTNDCIDAPLEFLRIAFFMRWIRRYVSTF